MLVSVIIPTYKRADTLKRAIDSVLSQTCQDIEVIVVDDNEINDEYSLRVNELVDTYSNSKKVKCVRQEKHINGASARNFGVRVSDAKYIAFLDDDDEWFPDKIEKQIEALQKNTDCKGCSCLYQIIENGSVIRKCQPYSNDNLQFKVLCREVAICTPTFLCERESFLDCGGFDEGLSRHQDLQLFVSFLENNDIFVLNEILTNVYSDSKINQPKTKQIIETKKMFFNSIQTCLSKYDKCSLKRIKHVHEFEIVFVSLRNKNLFTAIKYLFKIGFSLKAYRDLFKRIKSRKK